jgi:hypothetical protein
MIGSFESSHCLNKVIFSHLDRQILQGCEVIMHINLKKIPYNVEFNLG